MSPCPPALLGAARCPWGAAISGRPAPALPSRNCKLSPESPRYELCAAAGACAWCGGCRAAGAHPSLLPLPTCTLQALLRRKKTREAVHLSRTTMSDGCVNCRQPWAPWQAGQLQCFFAGAAGAAWSSRGSSHHCRRRSRCLQECVPCRSFKAQPAMQPTDLPAPFVPPACCRGESPKSVQEAPAAPAPGEPMDLNTAIQVGASTVLLLPPSLPAWAVTAATCGCMGPTGKCITTCCNRW